MIEVIMFWFQSDVQVMIVTCLKLFTNLKAKFIAVL